MLAEDSGCLVGDPQECQREEVRSECSHCGLCNLLSSPLTSPALLNNRIVSVTGLWDGLEGEGWQHQPDPGVFLDGIRLKLVGENVTYCLSHLHKPCGMSAHPQREIINKFQRHIY